jgi:hypothetical protein
MQQTSREANSHSASQEIPHLLWNPTVHYRVHKSPPLDPILSQAHQAHTFPSYFPKMCSNIILPSGSYSEPDASSPHLFSIIP